MKIRSDSLYAQLARLGLLDDIFGFIAADAPGYDALHAWLSERGLRSSNGALHNLITHHMQQWRISKALEVVASEDFVLPENIDEQTRARIKGLRLDLALRDISVDQALALIRLDQDKERNEIASRKLSLLESREAKAREAINDSALTPEAREQKLKEIFGLK